MNKVKGKEIEEMKRVIVKNDECNRRKIKGTQNNKL
jgi:hypothetical protein